MSEGYLPIRNSLGYQNVKQALEKIFSIDLDTIAIHEGEDENFNFPFVYKGYHQPVKIGNWKLERVACLTFGSLKLMNRDFPLPFYPR